MSCGSDRKVLFLFLHLWCCFYITVIEILGYQHNSGRQQKYAWNTKGLWGIKRRHTRS